MDHGVLTHTASLTKNRFRISRNCAICDIRNGIPMTNVWGYYTSRGGTQCWWWSAGWMSG